MPCNKIGYSTKQAAIEEARVIITQSRTRKKKVRKEVKKLYPYECRHCNKWHLTSAKRFKKHLPTQRAKYRKSKQGANP